LAAIKALGKLGQISGRTVPHLVDALKDSRSSVQIEAAQALAGLGPLASRGVVPLAGLLEHKDPVVRTAAAKALGRIGPAAALASLALAKRLGDSLTVSREAAKALGKIGIGAEGALLVVLGHVDPEVRRTALEILVSFSQLNRRSVKPLIRSLSDRDAGVRRLAVKALGRGGDDAIEGLVETLDGEDVSLQRTVARVLGEMGAIAVPAIPALAQHLMDPDHDVRETSKKALRSIRKATTDSAVHDQIDQALQAVGG
jgi:HEAT repeat protein